MIVIEITYIVNNYKTANTRRHYESYYEKYDIIKTQHVLKIYDKKKLKIF